MYNRKIWIVNENYKRRSRRNEGNEGNVSIEEEVRGNDVRGSKGIDGRKSS